MHLHTYISMFCVLYISEQRKMEVSYVAWEFSSLTVQFLEVGDDYQGLPIYTHKISTALYWVKHSWFQPLRSHHFE